MSTQSGQYLFTDDELASTMLAAPNRTVTQLAEHFGTSEAHLQYRISRPGFAYKMAILRNSGFADAATQGANGLTECLNVLHDEMKSTQNYSGERINAAKTYASIAFKANEVAIQNIEILRIRAFVEESERRRAGVVFDVESDGLLELPKSSQNGTASQRTEGVRVEVATPSDLAADANVGENRDIAPQVAEKLMAIVSKFTGSST